MLSWPLVPVAALAIVIGYGVGRMPRWQTWQGYAGLAVVAPIAAVAGVPALEIGIDCVGLGAGFALARR